MAIKQKTASHVQRIKNAMGPVVQKTPPDPAAVARALRTVTVEVSAALTEIAAAIEELEDDA